MISSLILEYLLQRLCASGTETSQGNFPEDLSQLRVTWKISMFARGEKCVFFTWENS